LHEVQSEYHTAVIEDMKDRADAHIQENRLFTIDELHEVCPYFAICLYEIVTVQLQSRKICATWV
jgi:hypothetical protein